MVGKRDGDLVLSWADDVVQCCKDLASQDNSDGDPLGAGMRLHEEAPISVHVDSSTLNQHLQDWEGTFTPCDLPL